MLQYHTHGVLQGCKGISAALMLSQPAAGVIVGLHRLVMAHVRNHDDADKLSAIITCTI